VHAAAADAQNKVMKEEKRRAEMTERDILAAQLAELQSIRRDLMYIKIGIGLVLFGLVAGFVLLAKTVSNPLPSLLDELPSNMRW
jgi:hypothetical protein